MKIIYKILLYFFLLFVVSCEKDDNPIIEGTRMVPIKFSQASLISSLLIRWNDIDEKGKYRFRIDYYDTENPDSIVVPYHDYSNIFKIQ